MESEHRVSTLELFFDLVFVFTITQLTVLRSPRSTACCSPRRTGAGCCGSRCPTCCARCR
ncbi:low temperature requirement protein A [Streptomyces virginiae]|uniref:low temperature requirement protein A n=1 Tax=Streptomyces virginiae TaxID=1961 RepID=UPI00371F13E9